MKRETVLCSTIDRDAPKIEVPVSKLKFRPSVYGVLLHGEKVLLHGYDDGYDFPGGGVNLGESLKDALDREIMEETGLSVDIGKLLHVEEDFFIHPATEQPHQTFLFFFACSNPRGELTTAHFDEHEKTVARLAEWIPIEQVPDLKHYNPLSHDSIVRLLTLAQSGAGI